MTPQNQQKSCCNFFETGKARKNRGNSPPQRAYFPYCIACKTLRLSRYMYNFYSNCTASFHIFSKVS